MLLQSIAIRRHLITAFRGLIHTMHGEIRTTLEGKRLPSNLIRAQNKFLNSLFVLSL